MNDIGRNIAGISKRRAEIHLIRFL